MKCTSVFSRNIALYNQPDEEVRVVCNKGGTRSSKTWSLLQLLYLIALYSKTPLLISVVSESLPHLKKGCIRDFETMLKNEGLWNQEYWNATDKIYKVGLSKIEFFSADSAGKVHGPARDILFMNECNNIPFETYRQLAIRTRRKIFLDYNPCSEFWVDEEILTKETTRLIHSTYKDNEFLTAAQIAEIESNKHDKNWWDVYGLGITGSKEGLIIQNYAICRDLPEEYKQKWFGLDFGFTNDPTAIVEVRLAHGELWVHEHVYEKGLENPQIAKLIKGIGCTKTSSIVAESAEPKSISEINSFGLNLEPVQKGSDSLNVGIDILRRYKINITKESTNVIKEVRNYKWKVDKNGKPMNVPIDLWNHSIDALRYVALNKLQLKPKQRKSKYTW